MVASTSHFIKFCHRSGVQGFWRIHTSLRGWDGDLVDKRPDTARSSLWKQRSVHLFISNRAGLQCNFTQTTSRAWASFWIRAYHDNASFIFHRHLYSRYANARHAYAFPRVSSMLGDGHTSYDFANDGDKQSIGACSVSFSLVLGGAWLTWLFRPTSAEQMWQQSSS